jgi:hypothetical protein
MITILAVKIFHQSDGLELNIIGQNTPKFQRQITAITNNTCLFIYTTISLDLLPVFWLLKNKINRILPMHHT